MATHTPNLNLYMPDSTDDFGDFRAEHNDNMVKIDNAIGGGGGSGGHTIIDENGNSLPQESGLQFTGNVQVTDDSVNNKTVVDILGGGGNVYGAFIDPNRSLTSSIAFSNGTPINYTATEDCIVELYNDSANALEYCVDGLAVYFLASGSYTLPLPLKKGQTLTSVSANSYTGAYHAYGLTQGTNGIFTPIIYSDTERVVGIWRDNKPLYQKSVYVGSLSAGLGVSLAHNIANIETIANYEGIGFNTVESRWNTLPRVDDDVTYQRGFSVGTTNIVIQGASNVQPMSNVSVTIWYTKTTDVAGSGNWNTDGVPTVHYSTSEQVIGTWLNGKPLYEISFEYHGNINANATTVIADVASLNIDDFVSGVGTGYEAGWGWGQLPANGSFIRYDTTTNKLQVQTASFALANTTAYFTIRYTKTTD